MINHDRKLENAYVRSRSWFIVFTVALLFGIVWSILGDNNMKIVYVTIAFMLFLGAGVNMEMRARALHKGDH